MKFRDSGDENDKIAMDINNQVEGFSPRLRPALSLSKGVPVSCG